LDENLPSSEDRVRRLLAGVSAAKLTLKSLSPADFALVVQAAVFDGLKADAKIHLWAAGVDLASDISAFLGQAGGTDSAQTRRTYKVCLDHFKEWYTWRGIEPLTLTPTGADLFALEAEGSPATVRKTISGVSAFYSWLERRYPEVKNPFRGTRQRPRGGNSKPTVIPSGPEVEGMLGGWLEPFETAVTGVLALRGLRVGALESLVLRGNRFEAESKRGVVAGVMPTRAISLIAKAGLRASRPFEGWPGPRLSMRLFWVFKGLLGDEKVPAQYSAHDLRHFFAVSEYTRNHNIHDLKVLLGHSTIGMTERYLRGLGALGDS